MKVQKLMVQLRNIRKDMETEVKEAPFDPAYNLPKEIHVKKAPPLQLVQVSDSESELTFDYEMKKKMRTS
jgi:hypothetical protein